MLVEKDGHIDFVLFNFVKNNRNDKPKWKNHLKIVTLNS